MVDPTTSSQCPVCGYAASVNQMGQMYSHGGVNRCPYSGNTSPLEQGIYPIKFGVQPAVKVGIAHERDGRAATARYEFEHDLEAGDHLSLRDADGNPFGHAPVVAVKDVKLNEVRRTAADHNAVYSLRQTPTLLERMNGYYADELDWGTEVETIVFTPTVTGF